MNQKTSKFIRERNLLITLTLFQLSTEQKSHFHMCTANCERTVTFSFVLSVVSYLLAPSYQCAKKVVSNSLGLVDFVNRLVNCVLNLMGK